MISVALKIIKSNIKTNIKNVEISSMIKSINALKGHNTMINTNYIKKMTNNTIS